MQHAAIFNFIADTVSRIGWESNGDCHDETNRFKPTELRDKHGSESAFEVRPWEERVADIHYHFWDL